MNNNSLWCPLSLFPSSLSLSFPCYYSLSSFLITNSSFFPPCFPSSSRSDRVPGDDGRGLCMGWPRWPDWPTADPPHLPLHQQRVCLLLVLRPGLQLLPLLPPGLWCGVRREMSHTGTTAARAGNESHDHSGISVDLTSWRTDLKNSAYNTV